MAKKKWQDLSDRQKALIAGGAALDAGLRLYAGRDLATRERDEVRGPKWLWGVGLAVVNSVGVLPAIYLLLGRRSKPGGYDVTPG
ncbi:MAG: DUF5652 family protein [Gordonia sp. (in: high G+C Gram-positive bacteria)]|uniref:DUF5652 family protein n=1 Tax=Gordonia sp. (in: high G+C Gram-positive bacteria) TaxID=84139 RepID=UPI0039E33E4F